MITTEYSNNSFCRLKTTLSAMDKLYLPSAKQTKLETDLEVAIVVKGKKGETPKLENEADRKKREGRRPTIKRPKGMRCPVSKDGCPVTYSIGNDTIGLSKEVRRVHFFSRAQHQS